MKFIPRCGHEFARFSRSMRRKQIDRLSGTGFRWIQERRFKVFFRSIGVDGEFSMDVVRPHSWNNVIGRGACVKNDRFKKPIPGENESCVCWIIVCRAACERLGAGSFHDFFLPSYT